MREYHIEFEKLTNHIERLYDAFYKSCFNSGVKDAIRYKVKIVFLGTMIESKGLDKLMEEKIIDKKCSNSTFVLFKKMISQITSITPSPRTTHFNHFSEVEMRECKML